eukprot:1814728-Prymnesium_polylepis.1
MLHVVHVHVHVHAHVHAPRRIWRAGPNAPTCPARLRARLAQLGGLAARAAHPPAARPRPRPSRCAPAARR